MSCIIAASGFPHTAYSKYFPPKIHEVFFIRWHWYLALIGIQFGPMKFIIVFTADIFALKQWFDWLVLFFPSQRNVLYCSLFGNYNHKNLIKPCTVVSAHHMDYVGIFNICNKYEKKAHKMKKDELFLLRNWYISQSDSMKLLYSSWYHSIINMTEATSPLHRYKGCSALQQGDQTVKRNSSCTLNCSADSSHFI